jgi:ubiquinone/menaquinone biosynthesis C-methylase UbiE
MFTSMDPVRTSYDRVARRYADEIGPELAAKPVDRALYALFAELVGEGAKVGDVGCGPGHVTAYLAKLGLHPVGVDISPGMVDVARERYPWLEFAVGTFAQLPAEDRSWTGAVAPYSVIHVEPADRPAAWRELARVLRPGGYLMVAFHIEAPDQPVGSVERVRDWFGYDVDLRFHYLDPAEVTVELRDAGFDLVARTDREPDPDVEYASRRSYLLARLRTVVQ